MSSFKTFMVCYFHDGISSWRYTAVVGKAHFLFAQFSNFRMCEDLRVRMSEKNARFYHFGYMQGLMIGLAYHIDTGILFNHREERPSVIGQWCGAYELILAV